jgi:osmotically-inducible protein OsmY
MPHDLAPKPGSADIATQSAPTTARRSDAQIASDAARRLAWDAAVPEHTVTVNVAAGRITLLGELQNDRQRAAALEDVTRLFGVSGVSDHIVVKAT